MEKLKWKEMSRAMASSYDPALHARQLVDSYNETPGELGYMDCPKCRNKGLIAILRSDNTRSFQECSCKKTRSAIARMERSGLKSVIREMTFEKFQAKEPWQEDIKTGAMAYAREGTGWFFVCGQPGSGKTHLCTAICRERIIKGDEVFYMSWREEATRLKALFADDPQRQDLMGRCNQAELLYIDDLFKVGSSGQGIARPTTGDINLAFEILNHRYCRRLPTVVSTQLQITELLNIDEAVGSRILELAGSHVYTVNADRSRNYRLRNLASHSAGKSSG